MQWRMVSAVILSSGLCLCLAACGSGRASDLTRAGLTTDTPHDTGLYIDWDDQDYHLDRFLQVSLRDHALIHSRGPRNPAADYRRAVTYEAVWDSVGLAFYSRLNANEQADRSRLAARHLAEARRLVLAMVHHHRNLSERGYLPNVGLGGMSDRLDGVQTVVTAAIKHLIRSTGLDPSQAAAWRDLAYFSAVVGDRTRQRRALESALAALHLVDPQQTAAGDLGRLRRDITLDLAWLAHEQDQPDLVIAYIDDLEPWLNTPAPENSLRRYEALLLRGLALAKQDDRSAAAEAAKHLPSIRLHVRAMRALKRADLHWHLSLPNGGAFGFMRSAWPQRNSDFGRHWIRAMIGASSGDPSHTVKLLQAPPTDLELPSRLAWRYWQDRGRLHALANDHVAARRCYQWAAYYRPFLAFFPLHASHSPTLLSELGEVRRYYTGYELFFLCGDHDLYQSDLAAKQATSMAGQKHGL